jgi:hypothetical protein
MPLFMPRKSDAWDSARDVIAFPAEDADTGAAIDCAISREALVTHFGGIATNVENLLDAFRRYRPAIESAASSKYDRASKPERLLLTARDFAAGLTD